MADKTEAEVVAGLTAQANTPTELERGKLYAIADQYGGVKVLDTEEYSDSAQRLRATPVVRDVESFNAYLEEYATGSTEIWADRESSSVVAVIDSIGSGSYWGKHRVTLALKHTVAWSKWLDSSRNGKKLDQIVFAEHIEDRAIDIVEPTAATILEIAQTFKATKGVDFTSSSRLSTGEVKFVYSETVQASAGKKGDLEIPETFILGIAPYEGGDAFKITARLRYAIRESNLAIGYTIERPEDVLTAAFDGVIAGIKSANAETSFYFGKP